MNQTVSIPLSLAVKLGSLAVHVQEAAATGGNAFDVTTLMALSNDPEITEWLATIDPVFLPERR